MIKKSLTIVVFLSILLTFLLTIPKVSGETSQAAMDSATQKSVKLPIIMLYHVLPILKEMDMKAVLSIVGAYADEFSKKHDPDPNYGYLSWDEIRILKESGYFEIQNHSYAMHTLNGRRGCQRKSGESEASCCSTFSSDVMKQQILLQEHCGITATAFTHPFGLVCPEAQDCLLQIHFSASFTCVERINYIQAGNPDCLFNLGRFNRSGRVTTKVFMKRILNKKELIARFICHFSQYKSAIL